MANNCLVTQLKASANNDMLCGLNEVRIRLQAGEHFRGYMWQYPIANAKLNLISGSATINSPSGVNFPITIVGANTLYVIVAGDGGAVISITDIAHLYEPDPIVFFVPTSLIDLQIKYISIDRIGATSVGLSDSLLYGDLASLSDTFNIRYMTVHASDIYGDIRYIGRLPALIEFINAKATKITGDVINVAKIARGKGRNTGSIYIRVLDGIKFNGEDIPVSQAGFKEGTLSWTDTTITFGGTTIENSDVITE